MAGHPADGTLHAWQEIADKGWDTLLVGNGLSINVSPDFGYESLYEEAEKSTAQDRLTVLDRAIFERFRTRNFEVVLGKLRDAIALAEALGRKKEPYRRRFRSIQAALGTAIRDVHLERWEVPNSSLGAIKAELENYRAIFSTSYDLIVYWAIGHNEDYRAFCDCFWANGRNEFDPDNCEVWLGRRPVYYMHGALHLVVQGSGVTRKLTRNNRTLLDQFGKPITGDPEARPLLITEGAARDKLRAIEGNDYLAHVYEALENQSKPLLVFGHALGEQDRHLVEAINANPERPVAVSMVKESRKKRRERQAAIWGKLDANEVYFYDAATHPLGSSALRTKEPRVRCMRDGTASVSRKRFSRM